MRNEQRREETRAALLEAATQAFSDRGYDATGVAELCRRAGVSKAAFYYHFERKQAIFMAMLAMVEEGDEVIVPDPEWGTFDACARLASKAHTNGSKNPMAFKRRALTPQEVLAARVVVEPLTVPMMSPINDGAAAAIVRRATGAPGEVTILGSALRTLAGLNTRADFIHRERAESRG